MTLHMRAKPYSIAHNALRGGNQGVYVIYRNPLIMFYDTTINCVWFRAVPFPSHPSRITGQWPGQMGA